MKMYLLGVGDLLARKCMLMGFNQNIERDCFADCLGLSAIHLLTSVPLTLLKHYIVLIT
jgi:hypothetical protein